MPWKTSSVMAEKLRFVFEHELRDCTMTELCERYEITRQTWYVWFRRYSEARAAGPCEHSRAARRQRNQIAQRIEPRAIAEAHSRYLLRWQAVEKADRARVQAVFEAAFREYGLPAAIRTDNGAPFASRALAGLLRLAVWWIKLGIVPERIEAGHPEQNGRHERMHRTLKQETADPPAANRRQQQRAQDRFRQENNEVRPHEALGMRTPAEVYEPSARKFPEQVARTGVSREHAGAQRAAPGSFSLAEGRGVFE